MKSKVYFIGAGPGDPDLITVKGVNALRDSDVVIYDRLVNEEILSLYCKRSVRLIQVGKQGYSDKSFLQSEINQILVEEAKKEQIIARLKGGDVNIFGNLLDELESLYENEIPYEIIPGITSALGMSAYTGIPLTARNISKGVRFLTVLPTDSLEEFNWQDLSQTSDTLVFYMSILTSRSILENLKIRNCGKPFAFIQNATTPYQKVNISEIQKHNELTPPVNSEGPALLVVGDVISFYNRYRWFMEIEKEGSLFALL
jgi:uroporphyrin-III C-methyltransferase / precorrin-2 dehydrogenase / sirohydrochlorin ferrochelatase